ncbi:MAG TPA: GDSL-type esterase/lipase family protein [Flavipsychrobacter sp.]|nr:GDSL-type esterase/lipase family protein [Flavipsychrobacter sp.]
MFARLLCSVSYIRILLCTFFFLPFISGAQKFSWVQKAGDNNNYNNYGAGVAIDHHHNIIVVGTYADNCMFGTLSLTTSGSNGIFLAKYDSSGNLLWVHAISGDSSDEGKSIALDTNDNIYIAGNMHSPSLYFTATDSLSNKSINWNGFIAKYDTGGNFQWASAMNSFYNCKAQCITINASGDPIVGGYFQNEIIFPDTSLTGGSQNMFLAKYSPSGSLLWAHAEKSNNICFPNALACDTKGNIYATGKVSGDIIFNTRTLGTIINQSFNTGSYPSNFGSYLPNATLNFTGSYIAASGGVGNYFNYVNYDYFSNLEHFKVESNIKVTSTGTGVGIGKYAGYYILANFPLDTGTNKILLYTVFTSLDSSVGYKISVGDSLNISMQRDYDTVSATLINYTKNYTVSTGYKYLIGPPVTGSFMPNNGFYAIYFLGGTQNIYNFRLSSKENYSPLTTFVGNSITTGYYSGGKGHRYEDLLYNNSPYMYATDAGAGDIMYNVQNDTNEVISLHPQYVFEMIGVNDARTGTDTNVFQNDLSLLMSTYRSHNIKPVLATLVPQGPGVVDPFNRRIQAVAAADTLPVVDIWSALVDTATGYLQAKYNYGDNIHPNPLGHQVMAQTIVSQAPFLLDSTNWDLSHQSISLPSGKDEVFISKFDSTGNMLWFQLDSNSTASGNSQYNNYSCGNGIAVNKSNNIFVGGSLLSALYTTVSGPVILQDAFLAKYTDTGSQLWQKRFGNNTGDAITGLSLDNAGNPYVIGNYSGDITIGTTALPAADYTDIFFARYDPSGNTNWVKNAAGHIDIGNAITVDPLDTSVVATGSFNNSANFDSINVVSPLPSSPYNYDIFIAKIVTVKPDLSVSNIYTQANNYSIYPNPATNDVFINLGKEGNYNIRLLDITGQVIQNTTTTNSSLQMNLNNLPSGVYYISISENRQTPVRKKIVKL